jgi:hypothetical protein
MARSQGVSSQITTYEVLLNKTPEWHGETKLAGSIRMLECLYVPEMSALWGCWSLSASQSRRDGLGSSANRGHDRSEERIEPKYQLLNGSVHCEESCERMY